MRLQITSTPRETLVWALSVAAAAKLRRMLTVAGHLVLDADTWELDTRGQIPEGERDSFDAARILNVEIGADANVSLTALRDVGYELVWHPWQQRPPRKVWGVTVKMPSATPFPTPGATHFGLKLRGGTKYGLRLTREKYALINKRTSMPLDRERDPGLWEATADPFEDADHRLYTEGGASEYARMSCRTSISTRRTSPRSTTTSSRRRSRRR